LTGGSRGTQTLNVSGTGRYIWMYGTARATGYGYSLWEFGIYSAGSAAGGGSGGVLPRDGQSLGVTAPDQL
jgi:beta-glucosidase